MSDEQAIYPTEQGEQRDILKPKPLVSKELRDAMAANTKESERDKYFRFFNTILREMFETTKTKNNDYGGADDPFKNFREFGELGILVRMSDKFARIKTALAEKRELQVKDEVIEDTIIDLAVYAVILVSWRRMKAEYERKLEKTI